MLYYIVKLWARIVLYFFYSRVEIIGRKSIPRTGGVIFAPNHQGAFMDAVIVGTYTSLKVTFLTRADIFNKWSGAVLKDLGMTPIYRIRDGYQSLSQNDAVFEACFERLYKGKSILIFPEGNHSADHYLRPLSKGTARLALNARNQIDPARKLYIVPTGINYFSHTSPRSKLTLVYGDPIDLSSYMELYNENNQKAYNKLREDLDVAMRNTLILHEKQEDHEARKKYVFRKEHEKLKFKELKKLAEGPIPSVQEKKKSTLRRTFISFFSAFNFPPLFLLRSILKKVRDTAFYLSFKCFAGSTLFLIWWVLLYFLGNELVSWEFGLLLVVISIQFLFGRQILQGY